MADLKTTYKDDLLDTSVNEKRKYNMIQNADGTVSFEDVTTYSQIGDSFGAADINSTNEKVNEVNSNLKYEADETICGTWLGETLYRKVFHVGTPISGTGSVNIDDTGIGIVVNTHGYVVQPGNPGNIRIPIGFTSDSHYCSCFYNPNTHTLEYRSSDIYGGLDSLITLEYIK